MSSSSKRSQVTGVRRAASIRLRDKKRQPSLCDVLDAAEQLDPDSQDELVAILKRRVAERGRDRVIADVKQARREFARGRCKSATAAEIVGEAQS